MRKLFLLSVFIFTIFSQPKAQPNSNLPTKIKGTELIPTSPNAAAQSNGLKSPLVVVALDTLIKVAPTYAYASINITKLTGTTQMDILNGKNSFWIFDKKGNEVKVKPILLKSIKASMGIDVVDVIIKIPFKLKTDKNLYSIHYKWESANKIKNIDVITTL